MRRSVKVISLLMMIILLLAGVFSGCAGNVTDTAEEQPTGKETKEETKVDKPAERPKISVWTLEASDFRRGMDKCMAAIADEVDVEITGIPDTQYETKLRVAISGGSSPDVISIDSPTLASYVEQGALMPLDDLWPEEDRNDLSNASKEAFVYKGKWYAAPFNENCAVVYYNKDMFEAAGLVAPEKLDDAWTWEELTEAAIKLTQRDTDGNVSVYGFLPLMAGPNIAHEGQNWISNLWTWQAGAEIISPDGTTVDGYFNSPESLSALKWFSELYTVHEVSPLQDIPNGFQTGKIAMWVTGPWMISVFKETPELNYGAMPLPKGPGGMAGNGGAWSFGISSTCENPEAAFKVLMAVGGKEGMKTWCNETGNGPARKSLYNDPELTMLEDPTYKLMIEQMETISKSRPVTPAYPTIAQSLQKCFNDIAYGKNPEEAMSEYSKIMNDALAKVND